MRYHELMQESTDPPSLDYIRAEAEQIGVTFEGWEDDHEIVIAMLERDFKESRSGAGAEIMRMICRYADAMGKEIGLTVIGASRQLIHYYGRFSFMIVGTGSNGEPEMRRKPRRSLEDHDG